MSKVLKGQAVKDFFPFVEEGIQQALEDQVRYAARIAVYDDPTVAPQVLIIEPSNVRDYLAEITNAVTRLSHERGGTIPFTIIREIVENYIHAAFIEPSISIFDGGNTIRFCDQGPGIPQKERALEIGTTSATDEMKHYIRGVGSGLPIALQYMRDKGGSLTIEDNISTGTIVTISIVPTPHVPAAPSIPLPTPLMEPPSSPTIDLSPRGQQIMSFLSAHDSVGGVDLVAAYGGSQPTWSRELKSLDERGITRKAGQRRVLTEAGRALLSSL